MSKPKSFRSFLLLVLFLFVAVAFAAQIPNFKSNAENLFQSNENIISNQSNLAVPILMPSPTPELTHNLVAAFYDVQTYPNAKLLLNNKGLEPIQVSPTLYDLDGVPMIIPPVSVPANSHIFVNLSDWANLGGTNFQKGSLKLFHTGKDLIIGSQIYLEDAANSLSFEERLAELGKFDSRRFEAIWAMPRNQTQVQFILSNTSDTTLSVNAKLSKKPQHTGATQTFTLQPHQTRVLDLRNDFADGNQFANSEVVGLTLEHTGEKSALKAHGQIKDAPIGYSNIIAFSNPASGKSSELHGTGFHLGIMGGEELEPVVAVKNVGTTQADVTIKVPYTRTDGTSGTVNLNSINLKEGEMRLVNMNPVIQRSRQEQIQIAGIEISYNTTPGSVAVQVQSLSTSKNQVYRVPMADPLAQTSSTGGYPWRIEETSRTVSYIKNMTDLEQNYIAYLTWENGGEYMIGIKKLAPNKTIEIDVKKLRDEQTPDERGRTIPITQTSGQIKWTLRQKYQTDNPKNDKFALIGRSEQIDTINSVSSSYACQNCCTGGTEGAFISTVPYQENNQTYEFEVGDTVQFYAHTIERNCYNEVYYCLLTADDWDSENTSVATVNSSGLVTIVGAGNVEIEAELNSYSNLEGAPCLPGLYLTEECKDETPKEPKEEINQIAPCGQCDTLPQEYHPDADISAKPKIKILRNGNDITSTPQNQNIQNVVVGEKIELSTTVTGGTASSKQWTIPGDKVKNYVAGSSKATKTDLPSQDLNQSSVQFYWFTGENNREVTFSITINQQQYPVKAKFNVKQPSITLNTDHSIVAFATEFGQPRLVCGENADACVEFTAQANNNGIDGSYQWVQTYNESKSFHLIGQIENCSAGHTLIRVGEGLDKTYPYIAGLSMEDFPAVSLLTTVDITTVI